MATCKTLSGRLEPCKDSVGGLRSVYFTDFGITTVEGSDEIITDIKSGSFTTGFEPPTFSKYQLVGSSAFNQDVVFDQNIGMGNFYQKLDVQIKKLDTQTNFEIKKLFNRKLQAVVHDNNGKAWLLGHKNGLRMEAGASTTGGAMGDKYGYNMSFNGSEESLANYLSGSTIADPFAGMITQPIIITGSASPTTGSVT